MGCSEGTVQKVVSPIPSPEGPPQDPLSSNQDIVEVITRDPHINFFQKKLQEVILPIRRRKPLQQKETNINTTKISFNTTTGSFSKNTKHLKTDNKNKLNKISIETFATADKKEHEKYVESVNSALQNNDASVTNIMALMIEEMADIREGKKAREKFGSQTYAALKCFIYLYTGHYTYKKINSQLRRSQYQKISTVIAVVQKQLEEYNKQKFARKLKANKKHGQYLSLYRGIPKPDKTMIKYKKQYWKGFTSTSLETSVASRFGKYLFIISLDKASPHAYMIVPEQLSQFKQEQIILFPYFHFQVTQVQDFTSGARYDCKQTFSVED